MSKDILVRLVNVTKYFRNVSGFSKVRDLILPKTQNHSIEVKNITIHLYRSEVLGLVGLPGSGKSVVGKLMAKVVAPSEGKVKNEHSTFLASHNHIFGSNASLNELLDTILIAFNVQTSLKEKRKHVLEFAEMDASKTYNDLSDFEKSKLMISLAYFLKPEVVIFDDLYRHLDAPFKERFGMVIDLLVKEQKSIVLMDSELTFIEQKANYITWLSHGQIRKAGLPKEVLPLYKNYVKDFESCRTDEERELFDLDYKMKRANAKEDSTGFSRKEKYGYAIIDEKIQRLFFVSFMLMTAVLLAFVLMANGIGVSERQVVNEDQSILKKEGAIFTDKYAYALMLGNNEIKGPTNFKVPYGTVFPISGYNDQLYRLDLNKKAYTTPKKNIVYINPAALYDEVTLSELEPYIYDNYINYRDFFNAYLGKSHATINKELYPETNDRYSVKLTKNNIYLHFDDFNELNALSFPLKNEKKLIDKYNIKDDYWISKVGQGFIVADLKKNTWIYIQM